MGTVTGPLSFRLEHNERVRFAIYTWALVRMNKKGDHKMKNVLIALLIYVIEMICMSIGLFGIWLGGLFGIVIFIAGMLFAMIIGVANQCRSF